MLRFAAGGNNEFTFDTGILRGKLRADGKSKGLSSVVHVPSGTLLDKSMGLFSHYRVFSAGKRYGTAGWDWPSKAQLSAEGNVEVRWPATADRPFELRASYHWAAPNALDLETTVLAQTNLTRFESFLASYFTDSFTNCLVWANPPGGGSATFVPAEKGLGDWLAFPRDAAAASIIRDGRWQIPPNPVDWKILPPYAKPMGLRRNPGSGLTAVLMSRPQDCFALCTPQQSDTHNSLYLCLFGMDLKPGQEARAKARLVITPEMGDAQDLYADYLKGTR